MLATKHPITAPQIKAARALLDWSQEHLAEACGLSIATIHKIESGHISPRNSTMGGIQKALEEAGLEFIDPCGVRKRPEEITVYEGEDGLLRFFDDVYSVAQKDPSSIMMTLPSEDPFETRLEIHHLPRMTEACRRIKIKCILTENKENIYCTSYCDYRYISKNYVDSVPFYVYADNYAIIVLTPFPKVTVLRSRTVADAFRRQFHSMWEKAAPLNPPTKSTDSPKVKKKQR